MNISSYKKIVVSINDVSKSFGDNVVLDHFNLDVYEGESLVVMGKSGSGKSVLIKCLVGLIKPDEGEIKIFDKDVVKINQEALDSLRADIGFLFQGSALYDSMTVRENLEFPLRRHAKKFKEAVNIDAMVEEALQSVGLLSAINLMPSELSGGMKKRIALARALILKPKIILYDEPTSGLDPVTANEIILLMKSIQKKYNTTSLIITHDLNCAKSISDRIVFLIDGKNYLTGRYEQLSQSNDVKVKAFFNQ